MPKDRSNLLRDTYEVISTIGQAKTLTVLGEVVERLVEPYGPHRYWIGMVPNHVVPPEQQPDMILASRWPEEWARRYFSRGYAEIDPVVRHVRTQNGAVAWRELHERDGRASVVMDEAAEFGLRAGLSIPQSTMDNIRIGISFAGREIDDDPRARVALSVIAATAAARSIEINQASSAHAIPSLSPREMDCLLWLIEGKTDWEIGTILGISRSAVVKHINSMRAKLGVGTRTQIAVAALRLGIVS